MTVSLVMAYHMKDSESPVKAVEVGGGGGGGISRAAMMLATVSSNYFEWIEMVDNEVSIL